MNWRPDQITSRNLVQLILTCRSPNEAHGDFRYCLVRLHFAELQTANQASVRRHPLSEQWAGKRLPTSEASYA